jgi:DNA-binding response OmpR family regulator
MCRALRVLCAASGRDRLNQLKRASVSVHWELVGGATALEEVEAQAGEWRPDVVVLDATLGMEAVRAVRQMRPAARIVSVGELAGADARADSIDGIREAVLGLPRPGGPVTG